MNVENWPISKPIPYSRNPRRNEAAISKVAGSIKEFGWRQPIVVDTEGVIIAGHTRLLAAQHLRLQEVPVHVATDLSPQQIKAYRLADNRVAQEAEWDNDLLKLELSELEEEGFSLDLTGFSEDELEALLAEGTEDGLTDEDETPEVEEEAITLEGDLWILGKHRLRCGDSTNAEHVADLLQNVQPHLMVTDPPYGVKYNADWRNKAKRADGSAIGASATGKVKNDNQADWSDAWALFPGDVAYVWHAGVNSHLVAESLESQSFKLRALICWAKNVFAIGRGDYHHQHEPCWYSVRDNKTGHWQGDRKQSTLWQIDKPRKSETGHSTQKPVECMRKPIENNSSPGQAVYEPFSGSGTTIIAAETTSRVCYAMELHPPYVDVTVKRWQQFTGKEAILESSGKTFAEVEAERKA